MTVTDIVGVVVFGLPFIVQMARLCLGLGILPLAVNHPQVLY